MYQHPTEDAYDALAVLLKDKNLSLQKERVRIENKEEYNMCRAITELIEDGMQQGKESGEQRGMKLSQKLMTDKRFQDLDRALADAKYRDRLCLEYGIG